MHARQIAGDVVAFNAALCALDRGSQWQEAIPEFVRKKGAVSWSFVLVVQALMMLEDMSQAGLRTIHRKYRSPVLPLAL